MPGFDLARGVRRRTPNEATGDTVGMILLNHGVFTSSDAPARRTSG